jgi:hypothetical protein
MLSDLMEDGIAIEPKITAQDVDENTLLCRHDCCRCLENKCQNWLRASRKDAWKYRSNRRINDKLECKWWKNKKEPNTK